jgi:iron-sulfur cluster repair protein YtfE (RIC family)
MTQEEAKQKVKIEKSDIYPYSIYDNVDEIIDEIYDDFEKELKQGQDNYNKLWNMYSELKKENKELEEEMRNLTTELILNMLKENK